VKLWNGGVRGCVWEKVCQVMRRTTRTLIGYLEVIKKKSLSSGVDSIHRCSSLEDTECHRLPLNDHRQTEIYGTDGSTRRRRERVLVGWKLTPTLHPRGVSCYPPCSSKNPRPPPSRRSSVAPPGNARARAGRGTPPRTRRGVEPRGVALLPKCLPSLRKPRPRYMFSHPRLVWPGRSFGLNHIAQKKHQTLRMTTTNTLFQRRSPRRL